MQKLEGLFCPLVTPFTDDGSSVSEIRFARQIRHLLNMPVNGFAIATDCGEFACLSTSERKQLLEWAIRMASGIPVLTNVSSLSTAISLDLAQHASRHGARAVILMPPYYGVFTAEEHIAFVRAVSHYADITVVLVDPMSRLNEEVVAGLQDVPDLILAKDIETATGRPDLSGHNGRTSTDEFAAEKAVCSPLALLKPEVVAGALKGEEADLAKLSILEETLGKSKVSKAGLEVLGFEMGPPRPPVKPLAGAVTAALRTLLSS